MNSSVSKDDAFRIADSTDWLSTPLASLAEVDSGLRCQVCKDFYQTPMITSCSHTFCSLCIRRCLNNDGKCPTCRTPEQELKLRNNMALGDVVEAFKKARPEVLEYAEKPVLTGRLSPKRTLEEAGIEEQGEDQPRKRTRSSSRKTYNEMEGPVVLDEDDGDEDYIPEDGLVTCPICQGRMKMEQINPHLDHCDGQPPSSKQKLVTFNTHPSLSKPAKRPERLPHLSYSMFKDNALRKKLSELGISSSGSRQLLEKRHTEWITLWNANCDSKNPRSKQELRHDLEIWERTQGGRAPASSASGNPNNNITSKDFDGAAWASKHETSFQQLIAEARKKRAMKTTDAVPPEGGNSDGATATSTPTLSETASPSREVFQNPVAQSESTAPQGLAAESSEAPASHDDLVSAMHETEVEAASGTFHEYPRNRFFESEVNGVESNR